MHSFEQKYSIGTDDGNYQILWDISALLRDLANKKSPTYNYDTTELYDTNNFFGDPEYAMRTDVEKPCVIVTLTESVEKLIDGNHRLYKAKQLNIKTIQCYVLPEEYHKKFVIDYDKIIYDKVLADFIMNRGTK